MLLDDLLKLPHDSLELCLREAPYGAAGRVELVREVMGLANLPGSGMRHIVIGAKWNDADQLEITGVGDESLDELEGYAELIRDYLEPELKLGTQCGSVRGKVVAVLEISGCTNPPYMVSTDLSRDLLRGACWMREPGLFRPAGRRDFDRIYGARPRSAEPLPERPVTSVGLGFNNDPALHEFSVPIPDLLAPPSVVAARQLQNQIEVVKAVGQQSVVDSGVARLVHAQIYGSDLPYDERGVNTLVENYNAVSSEYAQADQYYFRETNALKLRFCLRNTGQAPLEQLTIVLTFPRIPEFEVQERLCPRPGQELSLHESDLIGYPRVKYYETAVQVRQDIELLPVDAQLPLFENALRVALQPAIAGKRIAIRYALHAPALDEPEQGTLKLLLTG